MQALLQIAGAFYCACEGADHIYKELKTLPIRIVHVNEVSISKSKRKGKIEINRQKELHQDHNLELQSLEVVVNNGCDPRTLLLKKRKPRKKPGKVKRSKLENQE